MVFFVLSGYLVGGSVITAWRRHGRLDTWGYAVAPLSRMWTVLIPTLVLTFVADRIGWSLLGGTALIPGGPDRTLGLDRFHVQCRFLQTVACDYYGSNLPLWSLAIEFWYYVALPFLAFALLSRGAPGLRVLAVLVAVGLLALLTTLQFYGAAIGPYFLIWLLGTAAAAGVFPLLVKNPLWSAGALLLYACAARLGLRYEMLEASPLLSFANDLVLCLLFTHLLVAMRGWSRLPAAPAAKLHQHLAGFSFSLYAIHWPILSLIVAGSLSAFGLGWRMRLGRPGEWLVFTAILALVIISGWLFSLLREAHTPKLRRAAMTRLTPKAGAAAPL